MIERDIAKSNSINLRFLLGAMETTRKMSQDAMCVRDPVNIKDVASAHTLSEK